MPENIWDRLPDETERAWAGFLLFRDAGVGRTLRAVARELHRGHGSCVDDWASKYRWWERAKAYDRHLDQVTQREAAKARRDMVRRHATLANNALSALQAPVDELQRRLESPEFGKELAKMPTRELFALIQKSATAIKDLVGVERTSRGVPAEILEPVPTDGESTSDVPAAPMFRVLTPEEVAEIRRGVAEKEAKSEMLPAE